jgi:hypothetical protein
VWLVSSGPLEAADSQGFGLEDFKLKTGQDLLEICSLDQGNASYWEAQAFCFGYFRGGADFQRALVAGPGFRPIACPAAGATVRDGVAVFVAYARAHPDQLTKPPMDVVFRAVSERWPCP